MQFIQAKIASNGLVLIAGFGPVVAQHPRAVGKLIIISHQHAGITQCAEVLGRIKAERTEITQATDRLVCAPRALGLCSILNDLQAVFLRQGAHGVHVRHLPEEMHGNDRLSLARHPAGGIFRIEVEGIGIRIDKDRRGAGAGDAAGGGKKGEGGAQHLITGTNTQAQERE